MEAAARGDGGGVARGGEGQGEPDGPGSVAQEVGSPQALQLPRAPGPRGDGQVGRRFLGRAATGSFPVPLRWPVEAERACQPPAPHGQRHRGAVWKELAACGSTLAVSVLRGAPISITSGLNQPSLLLRTMQHFVLHVFTKPGPGKGA
ncbi:hypothetical protein DBR06_SOUSAS40310021 [Sousa chinensis]|uniref:Uncharacterized protein n=1 Tax=Sousa chinensis TaxID=103600 RepID=A0A484GZ86_SOUCH|nr:hypothetical protein DBR06_SOUSAS40310021 [Sousa chinensis]